MLELGTIKRNEGESIPEYGGRVHQILNKVISQTLELMPNEKCMGRCEAYKDTAIGNFIRGLDKDTVIQLNGKTISDLDEAISVATQLDITFQSWNRANGETSKPVISENNENSDKSKNKTFPQKRVAHVKAETFDSKRHKGSQIQCHACKKFGHIQKNCRTVNNNPPKQNDKDEIICLYCSREGHKSNECFLKKKHNN